MTPPSFLKVFAISIKRHISLKNASKMFENLIKNVSKFIANLPKKIQKSYKIQSKTLLNFKLPKCSENTPKMVPKSFQNRPQNHSDPPKTSPRAPKTSPRAPKSPQDVPKTSPRATRTPRSKFDWFLVLSWLQSPMGYPPTLASMSEVCGPMLVQFLVPSCCSWILTGCVVRSPVEFCM